MRYEVNDVLSYHCHLSVISHYLACDASHMNEHERTVPTGEALSIIIVLQYNTCVSNLKILLSVSTGDEVLPEASSSILLLL